MASTVSSQGARSRPIMHGTCAHHDLLTFPDKYLDCAHDILTLLVTGTATPGFIEHCTHLTTWFIFINSCWNSHFHTFICLWSWDFIQDIPERDTNLPARGHLTEESKIACEPVIDLMKGQLHLRRLMDCLLGVICFAYDFLSFLHIFPTNGGHRYY